MSPSPVTLGRPLCCGPFRLREIAYAPGYRQARHYHTLTGVTLLFAGEIREGAALREELASPLSVVVKPAGVDHSDEVGPRGARTLQLLFDASSLGDLVDGDGGLADWRWLHLRPAAAAMLSLLRAARACVREPGAASAGRLEDRVLDTLATLPDDPPARRDPPAWLRRIREALDDELHRNPAVRELARLAGTHPVSVSRAFRRHFGCTITEYRRRERLRRAAASIAGSAHGLSRIAHEAGFADHPHLCREFREAAGVSPSEFRGLAGEWIGGRHARGGARHRPIG